MPVYKDYWEDYYAAHRTPGEPSPFAKDMVEYIKNSGILIDLGCGNGRDSVFFRNNSDLEVIGLDQCKQEITFLEETYGDKNLKFVNCDFSRYDPKSEVSNIYSRWTMHSIGEKAEDRTLKWTSKYLSKGGKLLIEARSVNDDLYGKGKSLGNDAFVTDHYRRFMNLDKFTQKLLKHNFKIIHTIESKGLAVYKDDDPLITRIIAEKQ